LILAHQLIAAVLNYANGAPQSVSSTITDANGDLAGINLLTGYEKANTTLGADMVGDAGTLDAYNQTCEGSEDDLN
jgi:hypothetical protein